MSRHREHVVAADSFTVEVWTRRGLQRFVVLFFIDLSSRTREDRWDWSSRQRTVDEPNRPEPQRSRRWTVCWEIAVILLTAHGTIDSAVQAMRTGAYDYITKPIDTNRLRTILSNASALLGTRAEPLRFPT